MDDSMDAAAAFSWWLPIIPAIFCLFWRAQLTKLLVVRRLDRGWWTVLIGFGRILDFGSFVCLACLPTHVGSLLSVDGEVTQDTSVRRGRVFWREARSPRGIVSLLVLARRTDKSFCQVTMNTHGQDRGRMMI